MNLPSKELLSEVLNVYVFEVKFIQENKLYYQFTSIEGSGDYQVSNINIFELAHKCKEWAYNLNIGIIDKYNYYIWSGIDHNGKWGVFATEFKSFCNFTPSVEQNILPFIYEDTEPESIFKACQWILDNKAQK